MGLKVNAAFTEEIRDGVGALKKQNEPFSPTRRAKQQQQQQQQRILSPRITFSEEPKTCAHILTPEFKKTAGHLTVWQ